MLPLGAYLLKPVQRILRYHLLLSHMKKKTRSETEGFSLVEVSGLADALCAGLVCCYCCSYLF